MLETLLVLIGFQLAGEALGVALALPVPGAVLGMMLLFAFFNAPAWRTPCFAARCARAVAAFLPVFYSGGAGRGAV